MDLSPRIFRVTLPEAPSGVALSAQLDRAAEDEWCSLKAMFKSVDAIYKRALQSRTSHDRILPSLGNLSSYHTSCFVASAIHSFGTPTILGVIPVCFSTLIHVKSRYALASGRLSKTQHKPTFLTISTAFFTFLRANLALEPSAMSSNVSTPLLEPVGVPQGLAPPSPNPLAEHLTNAEDATALQPESNLDDIPPLSLDVLTARNDRVDALKLVADSVAQQRQRASFGLVFHPLLVSGLVATLALTYQFTWANIPQYQRNFGTEMTLLSGVVMAYLMAIRYATAGYIQFAEELKWDWLVSPDTGEEDTVIGARFGSEIIGALVLRLETNPTTPRKKKGNHNHSHNLKGGKGVIRAWTTRLKYRGKGVGADLLYEAVRATREKCGKDAEIGFAAEHANSKMLLPEMFNKTFRRGERRAALALEKALGEWEGMRRKR